MRHTTTLFLILVAVLLAFSSALRADALLPADHHRVHMPTYGVSLALPDNAQRPNTLDDLTVGQWSWKNAFNEKRDSLALKVELVSPAAGDPAKASKDWAAKKGFTLTDRKTTLGGQPAVIYTRAYDPKDKTRLQPRLAVVAEQGKNTFALTLSADAQTNPQPHFDRLVPLFTFGRIVPNHKLLKDYHTSPIAFACGFSVGLPQTPRALRWFTNEKNDTLFQAINLNTMDSDFAVRIQLLDATGDLQARAQAYAKTLTLKELKPIAWKDAKTSPGTPLLISQTQEISSNMGKMRVRWACMRFDASRAVVFTQMIPESSWPDATAYEKAFDAMVDSASLHPAD